MVQWYLVFFSSLFSKDDISRGIGLPSRNSTYLCNSVHFPIALAHAG